MKRLKIATIILGIFVFSGCSNNLDNTAENIILENIDENIEFRVNSLYEHTKIMIQLSNDEKLEEIGLNKNYIVENSFLTTNQKIEILERAYYIDKQDLTINKRVENLEFKMDEMMKNWS